MHRLFLLYIWKYLRQLEKKTKKIWVDQGSGSYNGPFKNCIQHTLKKSLLLLKNFKKQDLQTYKSCVKTVYFDVLDNIANKYNKTYHRTIKIRPIDVKYNFYGKCNVDCNEQKSKLKICDHVKISKYKNLFAIGCTPNWSEKSLCNN